MVLTASVSVVSSSTVALEVRKSRLRFYLVTEKALTLQQKLKQDL
jgi:hypothetical protein